MTQCDAGMTKLRMYIYIHDHYLNLPVVPHKAVAEVSKIGNLFEGSLEVKLPTIWRDEKQSRAEAERRGRLEERRSEEKE